MSEGELKFSSENALASKIRVAIGAGDYDEVRVITPQFDRTDGKKIYYYPKSVEEYDALKKAPRDILTDMGVRAWAGADDGSWKLYLYPYEWYDHIPDGYRVTDIFGEEEPFKRGLTDDDKRFGCLSFGFVFGKIPEGWSSFD